MRQFEHEINEHCFVDVTVFYNPTSIYGVIDRIIDKSFRFMSQGYGLPEYTVVKTLRRTYTAHLFYNDKLPWPHILFEVTCSERGLVCVFSIQ